MELRSLPVMKDVLFVCTHNAGRSQMAEALFNRAAPGATRAEAAGARECLARDECAALA